jgi:endoglucanase
MNTFMEYILRKLTWIVCTGIMMIQTTQATTQQNIWVRYNMAGYTPNRAFSMMVMAEHGLEDYAWGVYIKPSSEGELGTALHSGNFANIALEASTELPFANNYSIALSGLPLGEYVLQITDGQQSLAKEQIVRVLEDPYSVYITQVLRFLRTMRSGSEEALIHPYSHLGDSAAIAYIPDGEYSLGAWKKQIPERLIDMRGGWYDAGDYIKFTLTISHTAYLLLRAYEENPAAFTKVYSQNSLVDVLDEATHGLDYLLKTFPDEDTFIIQVSTGLDHSAGHRLPQKDSRDGEREALIAISQPHMGSTAAALALGARLFKTINPTKATQYEQKAIAIFERATQPDALTSGAYELDAVNEFYRDRTAADNMRLGAAELFSLTGDQKYEQAAEQYDPGTGSEVSWTSLQFLANWSFKANTQALAYAEQEVDLYVNQATNSPWSAPSAYIWASLHRWIGAANAAKLVGEHGDKPAARALFNDLLDYTMGKNNWGLGMIASPNHPNSIQNIYSQMYTILGEFPKGGVSEGPIERSAHEEMEAYFSIPVDTWEHKFNTSQIVFYDNQNDFVTQEATTLGQAEAVMMLALALPKNVTPAPDTGAAQQTEEFDPVHRLPLSLSSDFSYWGTFTDASDGGVSTFDNWQKSEDSVSVQLSAIREGGIAYPYVGISGTIRSTALQNMENYDGLRLRMNIPEGEAVVIQLEQSSIKDYNHYRKILVGKGLQDYLIPYSELTQEWNSDSTVAFDPFTINGLVIMNKVAQSSFPIALYEVEFYGDEFPLVVSAKELEKRVLEGFHIRRANGQIHIHLESTAQAKIISIYNLAGSVVANDTIAAGEQEYVITEKIGSGLHFVEIKWTDGYRIKGKVMIP